MIYRDKARLGVYDVSQMKKSDIAMMQVFNAENKRKNRVIKFCTDNLIAQ